MHRIFDKTEERARWKKLVDEERERIHARTAAWIEAGPERERLAFTRWRLTRPILGEVCAMAAYWGPNVYPPRRIFNSDGTIQKLTLDRNKRVA
jgi:hypothetical protein